MVAFVVVVTVVALVASALVLRVTAAPGDTSGRHVRPTPLWRRSLLAILPLLVGAAVVLPWVLGRPDPLPAVDRTPTTGAPSADPSGTATSSPAATSSASSSPTPSRSSTTGASPTSTVPSTSEPVPTQPSVPPTSEPTAKPTPKPRGATTPPTRPTPGPKPTKTR